MLCDLSSISMTAVLFTVSIKSLNTASVVCLVVDLVTPVKCDSSKGSKCCGSSLLNDWRREKLFVLLKDTSEKLYTLAVAHCGQLCLC